MTQERGHIAETVKNSIVGLNAEHSVSAAATGAIRGAGEISSTAVQEVRNAVTGVIAGVKVAVTEPFRKDESKRQERKAS